MTNAKIIAAFLKRAAITSAKGATITLGSTVASCFLALQVEAAAHRTIYHYFPHKYAEVEHAFGLSQWQLDAVRVREAKPEARMRSEETAGLAEASLYESPMLHSMSENEDTAYRHKPEHDTTPSTPVIMLPATNAIDEEPSTATIVTYDLRPAVSASKDPSKQEAGIRRYNTNLSSAFGFGQREIIACSMTG